MSEPFIGEVRIFGFNFAPRGFALCQGQILPISQNQALFSILGTTYGGDGRSTFGLPDLRGRAPIHFGQGPGLSSRNLGQKGGAENHTIAATEMPAHSHTLMGTHSNATADHAEGAFPAISESPAYKAASASASMSGAALSTATGGNQQHSNMQPYVVINFSIALTGLFPSRN
jgi:microcystin-dependent protein